LLILLLWWFRCALWTIDFKPFDGAQDRRAHGVFDAAVFGDNSEGHDDKLIADEQRLSAIVAIPFGVNLVDVLVAEQ